MHISIPQQQRHTKIMLLKYHLNTHAGPAAMKLNAGEKHQIKAAPEATFVTWCTLHAISTNWLLTCQISCMRYAHILYNLICICSNRRAARWVGSVGSSASGTVPYTPQLLSYDTFQLGGFYVSTLAFLQTVQGSPCYSSCLPYKWKKVAGMPWWAVWHLLQGCICSPWRKQRSPWLLMRNRPM